MRSRRRGIDDPEAELAALADGSLAPGASGRGRGAASGRAGPRGAPRRAGTRGRAGAGRRRRRVEGLRAVPGPSFTAPPSRFRRLITVPTAMPRAFAAPRTRGRRSRRRRARRGTRPEGRRSSRRSLGPLGRKAGRPSSFVRPTRSSRASRPHRAAHFTAPFELVLPRSPFPPRCRRSAGASRMSHVSAPTVAIRHHHDTGASRTS
jgi:hypothetical protein